MLYVVINPTAGNGHAQGVGEQVQSVLRQRGIAFEAGSTEYAGHATQLAHDAAQRGVQTVVAVGGDGTVLEVMRGIYGTQAALGIIPAGTGNDVVKMLSVPRTPMEALDFLLEHPARPLDAGRINDTLFLNVCGTGIDVDVLEYTLSAKRFMRGILPYLLGVLRAICTYRGKKVRISVDDGPPEAYDLLLCAVANGRFIGGGMNVAPDASPDDGLFDFLLLPNMPRWRLPPHLPKLLNGKIREVPGAVYRKCKRVSFAGEGMRVNIDGEVIPMDSATMEILPKALMAHW